jgi:hypothetical protein
LGGVAQMTYSIELKVKHDWMPAGTREEFDDAVAYARTITKGFNKPCRIVNYAPEFKLINIFFPENA